MKENLHEGFSLSKVEIHEMIKFTDKDTTKIQNDTLYILSDIYFYIFLINEIISVYKIYKDGITLITFIITFCSSFPFLCGIFIQRYLILQHLCWYLFFTWKTVWSYIEAVKSITIKHVIHVTLKGKSAYDLAANICITFHIINISLTIKPYHFHYTYIQLNFQ